jgi:hypothetical protein
MLVAVCAAMTTAQHGPLDNGRSALIATAWAP